MTTSDELIAVLAQNPSDSALYLVTADLLEEEGNWELARAYRWCGENKKYPYRNPDSEWEWFMTWDIPAWNDNLQYRLAYKARKAMDFNWFNLNFRQNHQTFISCMSALAEHFDLVVTPYVYVPV